MVRLPLPSRRQSTTYRLLTPGGLKFHVTVGFYDDGKPGEVFGDVGKTPQGVQQIISDACILISIALQHGITGEELGKSLAYHDDGKPYTVIGAICTILTQARLGDIDENDKSGGDPPRPPPEESDR